MLLFKSVRARLSKRTFAASHMLFFAPTRRPLLFRVSDTPLSPRVAPRVRSDKFRQIG